MQRCGFSGVHPGRNRYRSDAQPGADALSLSSEIGAPDPIMLGAETIAEAVEMTKSKFESVDEYIASQPEASRPMG